MIKETWIAKIKEIGCWTEELITFCPFSPVSAWSKKLPNFAVKHVDLSGDFGHHVPCMGRRIEVNNEGGLDTRPSSLYWQIEPGCSSHTVNHVFQMSQYTVGRVFYRWPEMTKCSFIVFVIHILQNHTYDSM